MQASKPIVSINLFKDLEDVLRKRLATLGVVPGNSSSIRDLCLAYLNAVNRRLSPWKREVRYSKELSNKLPAISIDQRTAIQYIQRKAEQGDDLTPFMSKKVIRDYNDMLFNDWKIFHFHLGVLEPNGTFTQRTNELLYAYATKDILYLIDVLDHDPVVGFANQNLLQVMHDNWPDITRRFALQGVKAVTPVTDIQVSQLRKHGVSYSTTLKDGTVLFPLGGGYSSSGDNTLLVVAVDKFFSQMRTMESQIRSKPQEYISAIRREPKRKRTFLDTAQTVLDVRLVDTGTVLEVVDLASGCRLTGWDLEKMH